MNEALVKLFNRTVRIAENIEQTDYKELVRLVSYRGSTIEKLKRQDVISEEEMQLWQRILAYDEIIKGRMIAIRYEASEGLRKLKQSKMQKKVYAPVYTPHAHFFDKRK